MQPDAGDIIINPEGQPANGGAIATTPVEGRLRRPFWGYQDLFLVLGLLVAAIALVIVAAAGAALINPKLGRDPAPLLLPTNLAIYCLLYLIFRMVFGLRYGKPVFPSLGWVASSFRMRWAVAGGIVLAFVVAGLAALLKTPKVQSPIESLMHSPILLTAFGIMAVTVAPLFEELFFRGFLQPLLTRTFGIAAGILITAVLFGGLHAPEYSLAWQYAVAVSIVGAVLGWVRVRADSIVPSTIMHSAYNSVFVIALLVSKFHPHA